MKTRTGKSLEGCVVRSRRELSNQLGRVPAGTLFLVDFMGGRGLHLVSKDPCQHCGFSFKVSQVKPRDVEVVEDARR